ncbi:MBL fold metallo-hydrolase [Oceanobacillus halotolerans]|uniref:hypothetical protein n=1 Tax=Oceanobacillus halotolerans TaxID=2663380 RepID=UPI001CF77EC8|nr:hypothetical protein [Oceanobacillus halotolerans]
MHKRFIVVFLFTLLLAACGSGTSDNSGDEHSQLDTSTNEKETIEIEENETEATNESDEDDEAKEVPKPSSDLTVHYIAVGQADATLFQYADEESSYNILFDTGDWRRNDVINYLDA